MVLINHFEQWEKFHCSLKTRNTLGAFLEWLLLLLYEFLKMFDLTRFIPSVDCLRAQSQMWVSHLLMLIILIIFITKTSINVINVILSIYQILGIVQGLWHNFIQFSWKLFEIMLIMMKLYLVFVISRSLLNSFFRLCHF